MKTSTKLVFATGLVALFTKAIMVNGDPTGNNAIERGLSAVVQEVFRSKCNFERESAQTRAVCDALSNHPTETNYHKYSNNLLGTDYQGNERLTVKELIEASRLLKNSPRGLRPHSYTDDELRGFYFFLFNAGENKGSFMKMPYQLSLEEVAILANQSLERKCHSLNAIPISLEIKCE